MASPRSLLLPVPLLAVLLLVFLLPVVMGQGWFVGARHNESPALPLPVLPALLLLVLLPVTLGLLARWCQTQSEPMSDTIFAFKKFVTS